MSALALLTALLIGPLLLGACGSPATDGPPDAPTSAPSSSPPSAAPSSAAPSSAAPSSTAPAPDAEPPVAAGSSADLEVDGRPVELAVPAGYDASDPAPLLVALHGFGDSPAGVDEGLGLRDEAARRGMLYALPEGTPDPAGRLFWDAADACCGFDAEPVDDSGYLAEVIRTIADAYAVDPARVAVVGHSNGGFMAYRMACDHADLVTVAVSLAGAMPADDGACSPSEPVTVVQAHGTADTVIAFDGGGTPGGDYTSAPGSAAAWARLDGCADEPRDAAGALDLDTGLAGAETSVASYAGCAAGARVELWTIDGGSHSPSLGDAFAHGVLDVVADPTAAAASGAGR
ncbi:hypothetical protein GCM10009809_13260 [Isoptericola hypogeus]|uniref:Peptidase S9 prolyl oligopeptidase catalytic domain-containing protein n=1 Tax=Isoptericola hypogeus TaxID=300179 RepID=A0ABP4V6J0_9MICO